MIKKILILLFCLPFFTIAQELDETLFFIKSKSTEWACEKIVKGGLKQRLEIKFEDGILSILTRLPSSVSSAKEYYRTEIALSKVIFIEAQDSYKCSGIVIRTSSGGMKLLVKYRNESYEKNYEKAQQYYAQMGWKNDGIRIKYDAKQPDRGQRLVNALTHLAEMYGATIKKSSF